ncbi:hypothetical protein V2J09_012605 [Rumex salicifolius]
MKFLGVKMALVYDVVVSELVKLVLNKLSSAVFAENRGIFRVKGELKRLENTLIAINAMLLDAEEQQFTNNTVRIWLLSLKDVVYDIEDLLDLISTEELERKVKKTILMAKLFSYYRFSQELKAIHKKLDEIAENRRNYNFQDNRALTMAAAEEQRETWCPFYRTDIINLWMALGYFDELVSRSFLQLPCVERHVMRMVQTYNYMQGGANLMQTSYEDAISQAFRGLDGKVTCTEMHDVVHDLAAYVAGDEIATISNNTLDLSPRVKHLMMDTEDFTTQDFDCLLKARKARSFASTGPINRPFLERLISRFKCLRVLLLLHSEFEDLPDSIGSLKHLRYLNISGNSQLKLLPDSTCKLVNLQILHVEFCYQLKMLPKNVHKMEDLRVLVLTLKLTCFPERSFQEWSSLQVLKFTICPNLESLPEELGSLKSLRILVIRACSELPSLPNSMKNLINLEHLTIHSCQKLDLTGWKGLQGLKSLKFLIIFGIPKLLDFPAGIESVAGSLQYLRISECKGLRSLPEGLIHCTCLLKLQVYNCPNLRFLPKGFGNLKSLQELRIFGCSELGCRCQTGGDDWNLVCKIPEIHIDEIVIRSKFPVILEGH